MEAFDRSNRFDCLLTQPLRNLPPSAKEQRKLIAEAKASQLDSTMAEERLRQFFEQHAKLERKRLEVKVQSSKTHL